MRALYKFCLLVTLALLPLAAEAQQVIMQHYEAMSGTGFFVNRQYVITNAHVVKSCSEVMIKGAVPESKAIVKVLDETNDLALLETDRSPQQFAPLRFNIDDLKTGDKVLLLGYPGEAGARGEYAFATAQIENVHDLVGQAGRFYITDVVEHGNSGGPVFDTSGNVIGVVVAKSTMLYTLSANDQKTTTEKHLGAVISLATLKDFLFAHGVYTEWQGSSIPYADSTIEENAKGYIVNVQCRLPPENAEETPHVEKGVMVYGR